jgi:pyruvate dehydrogenase (quinone)
VGQQQTSAPGSDYQQEIDLQSLFKDIAAQFVGPILSADQEQMVLDRAFPTALSTRSPTVVIVPHHVQKEPARDGVPHEHGVVPTAAEWRRPVIMPRDEHLRAAADVVGSNDPWTEYYPAPGQARAVQADIDGRHLGNRYELMVGLTGDAADTLTA